MEPLPQKSVTNEEELVSCRASEIHRVYYIAKGITGIESHRTIPDAGRYS